MAATAERLLAEAAVAIDFATGPVPSLSSSRSHGSNPPQRSATPPRRSSFNFEELPEDVVVLPWFLPLP